MDDKQIIRELKRRLDAQTSVIEAIYKQLTDIYARLEALQRGETERRRVSSAN